MQFIYSLKTKGNYMRKSSIIMATLFFPILASASAIQYKTTTQYTELTSIQTPIEYVNYNGNGGNGGNGGHGGNGGNGTNGGNGGNGK